MNIGLTGGIATGKTTVATMLVKRGAILIDADQIAREVVRPGHPVLSRVVEHFGQEVLKEDGTLNREKLGEIIFNAPTERKRLEQIMHPAIRAIMLERMKAAESEHSNRLVAVDVPLLYESGIEHFFSEVMVVYVPESVQLERLMKRNGLNRQEAEQRIASQMPIEAKKERADVVIDNGGTLQNTEDQIHDFFKIRGMTTE